MKDATPPLKASKYTLFQFDTLYNYCEDSRWTKVIRWDYEVNMQSIRRALR